jgi:hypothetical protein
VRARRMPKRPANHPVSGVMIAAATDQIAWVLLRCRQAALHVR